MPFRHREEILQLVNFALYTAAADHVKNQMDRGLVDVGLLLEPIDIEKYDFVRLDRKEDGLS